MFEKLLKKCKESESFANTLMLIGIGLMVVICFLL